MTRLTDMRFVHQYAATMSARRSPIAVLLALVLGIVTIILTGSMDHPEG
jgi:hypothetical protein